MTMPEPDRSTDEQARRRDERKRRRLGWAAVIGIWFVFFALIGQGMIFYCTMVRAHADSVAAAAKADIATSQARNFILAAQQPILWQTSDADLVKLDKPSWSPDPKAAVESNLGYVGWNLHIKNFGVGTALKVAATSVIFINNTSCGQPNILMRAAILPPQGVRYSATVCYGQPMTQDAFKKLLAQDFAITIMTRFTYTDAPGSTYEADICQTNLASGAVAFCSGAGVATGIRRIE